MALKRGRSTKPLNGETIVAKNETIVPRTETRVKLHELVRGHTQGCKYKTEPNFPSRNGTHCDECGERIVK